MREKGDDADEEGEDEEEVGEKEEEEEASQAGTPLIGARCERR